LIDRECSFFSSSFPAADSSLSLGKAESHSLFFPAAMDGFFLFLSLEKIRYPPEASEGAAGFAFLFFRKEVSLFPLLLQH